MKEFDSHLSSHSIYGLKSDNFGEDWVQFCVSGMCHLPSEEHLEQKLQGILKYTFYAHHIFLLVL